MKIYVVTSVKTKEDRVTFAGSRVYVHREDAERYAEYCKIEHLEIGVLTEIEIEQNPHIADINY